MSRILLINPHNPIVTLTSHGKIFNLNKYRIWKPLSLMTIANKTNPNWDVEIVDENLGEVDYAKGLKPVIVGITAFTSQAVRAYQLAKYFKGKGCHTVMGGIHASMCLDEALEYFDTVITGEGELEWPRFLDDFKSSNVKRVYEGGLVPVEKISSARHDLLYGKYYCGAIQTTRGCPLRCTFCSVTSFNGGKFRHRPINHVIADLRNVREKVILFVDDNLVGVHQTHIDHTKQLLKEMIRNKLTTPWFCQATINFADDDELLELARKSGCMGVFIGFESPTIEGLEAIHKKFNVRGNRDFRDSVRKIQKHGIIATGSFIMGIDTDKKGIGKIISETSEEYGLDVVNVLMSTPLPGTALYDQMDSEKRIIAKNYPSDWQYYTLSHPVAEYKNFTWEELVNEMSEFHNNFYSYQKILKRVFWTIILNWRNPYKVLGTLIANVTYLYNHMLDRRVHEERTYDNRHQQNLHTN